MVQNFTKQICIFIIIGEEGSFDVTDATMAPENIVDTDYRERIIYYFNYRSQRR